MSRVHLPLSEKFMAIVTERFTRILKENRICVLRFETVGELRLAQLKFKDKYGRERIVGRSGNKVSAVGPSKKRPLFYRHDYGQNVSKIPQPIRKEILCFTGF